MEYFVIRKYVSQTTAFFSVFRCFSGYREYTFNSFLFSKSSLNKKLLNIYLLKVDERDTYIRPKNINMKE